MHNLVMRVACVQSDVSFGETLVNAERAIERLVALKAEGVDLAVFPEAYLTGYCVSNLEAAREISIQSDSEALHVLQAACDDLDILAVLGFAEKTDTELFNTAVLFESERAPRFYRKTHLPFLGLDRFVCAGDALTVFDTRLGRVGILICFDLRPPEASRVLALEGADIIVLPTNWPEGAEISADHIAIARAAENRVFIATCNRVGTENGFTFIGRSKLIGVTGIVLASAGAQAETIVADLDLSLARQKRTVNIPGEYETEIFASRNPALYKGIG
jgi:predicted amidohydrolase